MRAGTLRIGLLAVCLVSVTSRADASDVSVEVFTVTSHPIVNARGAPVHALDGVSALEQELSADLPADPTQAHALVAQRMAALGPRFQQRAQQAATGLARAAQLRVDRVPAIVFDGRWAVYGVTDVDAARRIYATRVRR